MTHGTRTAYQLHRCRCLPCRAANAKYRSLWYRAKRAGRYLLGVRVSAVEAHRLIRLLLRERFKKGELAQALGRHHDLARLTHQDMITLRTELKVRRFYRERVALPRDTSGGVSGADSA